MKPFLKFLSNALKVIVQTVFFDIVALLIAWAVLYMQGNRFAAVVSGSMEPAIPTGSLAVYDAGAAYSDVDLGNVVVYARPDGVQVCHRAIEITDEGIETKGDANSISDGVSTTRDNFKGILWMSIPLAGYAAIHMQNYLGFAAIACVLLLSFSLLLPVFTRNREKKKEKGSSEIKGKPYPQPDEGQEIGFTDEDDFLSVFDDPKTIKRKQRRREKNVPKDF